MYRSGQVSPQFKAAGPILATTEGGTVTWPTHSVGDLALLLVETIPSNVVSFQTGTFFVEVTGSPQSVGDTATGTRLTVFWKIATSSNEPGPVINDPGNHLLAQIITFRGTKTITSPWNVANGGTEATEDTTLATTALTTTVDNCLVVIMASVGTSTTTPRWSGEADASLGLLTERVDHAATIAPGNGGALALWTGTKGVAGDTGSFTATAANAASKAWIQLALPPSTADPGVYGISGKAATLRHSVPSLPGSYAVTGTAASLVKSTPRIAANSGSYGVSGTAAALRVNMPAASGVYAVTGATTALRHTKKLLVDGGTYALVGGITNLSRSGGSQTFTIVAASGSYVRTGSSITARHGVPTDKGIYTVAGTAANLIRSGSGNPLINAVGGSYAISGSTAALERAVLGDVGEYQIIAPDASLRRGKGIGAFTRAFLINGIAAVLKAGKRMPANSGTYTTSGQVATLVYSTNINRVINAEQGIYLVSGQPALLRTTINPVSGTYAVTGTVATLRLGKGIAATTGSYLVSGVVAALKASKRMVALAGSYLRVGTAASLLVGVARLDLDSTAFILFGFPATLRTNRRLIADSGSYVTTGQAANLRATRIHVLSGIHIITGMSVEFIHTTTRAWNKQVKPVATHKSQPKVPITWVKQSEPR